MEFLAEHGDQNECIVDKQTPIVAYKIWKDPEWNGV